MDIRQGLLDAERYASSVLLGRNAEARVVSLALLTRQHALMLGPPGCGKTMLAERMVERFSGCSAFVKALSPYTTRDEIEGPTSLAALAHDRLERVRDGRLFDCHLAVLDELFKAPEEVRSVALSALNERRDSEGRSIPLWSAVAASNEPPVEGLGSAFGDRLLFRCVTQPIGGGDSQSIAKLMRGDAAPTVALAAPSVPFGELATARDAVALISVPDVVSQLAATVVAELAKALKRSMSDRRILWALGVRGFDGQPIASAVKAVAFLAGRSSCIPADLRILSLIAWNEVEELPVIETILQKFLPAATTKVERILANAREVAAAIKTSGGVSLAIKANAALKQLEAELSALEADAPEAVADARIDLAKLSRDIMRAGIKGAAEAGGATVTA